MNNGFMFVFGNKKFDNEKNMASVQWMKQTCPIMYTKIWKVSLP